MIIRFRQKLIFFMSAFVLYSLFRYGLGPRVGLEGLWLILSAYGFALVFPCLYLYRLWLVAKKSLAPEDDK